MSNKQIEKLIINSPYEEPTRFWQYVRDTREFTLESGRRPAGYVIATPQSKGFDDPGIFVPIEIGERYPPTDQELAGSGLSGSDRYHQKAA